MLRWTGIVCGVAACYHPAPVQPCSLSCETAADCPNGLSCGTDSRCFSDTPCFMQPDAGSEAGTEAGARMCLGHWNVFQPCLDLGLPDQTLQGPFDTTGDMRCVDMMQTSGSHLCAVVGSHVMVGDLAITGDRPLAIVALDSVDITGAIDAASHLGIAGPNANQVAARCLNGGPGGDGGGGGGGGGGSFQGIGGAGGFGAGGAAAQGSPPDAIAASALDEIRAGCSGTAGGTSGSTGGFGGGALAIIAGQRISISVGASIDASGAPANGPLSKRGGGGGGAGGMIFLDASMIFIGGPVVAFGASGASGGSNVSGSPGTEPPVNMPGTAALGPPGMNGAGGGGDGCGPSVPYGGRAGGDGIATAAGGGGGGGAGYIVMSPLKQVSPMIAPGAIQR